MKILLTVASLAPAYGGPARSVPRLADALAEGGLEVGLWAPDGSAEATGFLHPESPVHRLAGDTAALSTFAPDVLHDNGIWLAHNHRLAKLAARRGLPRVVSTRGMLEPWAMRHKRWKKRLAWHLYQEADLKAAAGLHVTSAREQENVDAFGWPASVRLIPNGVDLPDLSPGPEDKVKGKKTALFVGRIYPVKGLPLLVEAWARARPEGWRMRIVGPDEAGHRAEVEALVERAGLQADVVFEGPFDGAAIADAYRTADLFILPSHTENFGMALAEALAHGLPVLTTKGTPWQDLPARGCGWWVDGEADVLASALLEATGLSDEDRAAMGRRGRAWMQADFGWEAVAKRMAVLYEEVVTRRG